MKKFIVRLYDGFDHKWMDVSEPLGHDEALRILNEFTKNGTKNTTFDDMDYYEVFPAGTVMKYRWKHE